MRQFLILFCAFLFSSNLLWGQLATIVWTQSSETNCWGLRDGKIDDDGLPFVLLDGYGSGPIQLEVVEKEACSEQQIDAIGRYGLQLTDVPTYKVYFTTERKVKQSLLKVVPFVKVNNQYYRVTKLHVDGAVLQGAKQLNAAAGYTKHSVLEQGTFVKLAVKESGIYKITYDELKKMGFQHPQHVHVYGYGGRMLYEDFSKPYSDDLPEVSLYVEKGADDVFNSGDYVLFYGEGMDRWDYQTNSNLFVHTRNVYSNEGYYFVTVNDEAEHVVIVGEALTQSDGTVSSFTDYQLHEVDLHNFINSGREFYGEEFFNESQLLFTHNLPNTLPLEAKVRLDVAAKSNYNTNFQIQVNNKLVGTLSLPSMANSSSYEYAKTASGVYTFVPQETSTLQILLNYPFASSTGWLNFYELNVQRALTKVDKKVLFFRNPNYLGQGLNHRFELGGATANLQIWDVTDVHNAKVLPTTLSDGNCSFIASTNELREYVAVDVKNDAFLSATVVGKVANQNLHGLPQVDMVIIASDLFMSEAERLAEAHRAYDGLQVQVVNAKQVYNEFSSGTPDATAYRRLMKMLYDRAEDATEMPSYLLLFGDGCFDNRKILAANALHPIYQLLTYQSVNSMHKTLSYVTDDYFGFLDDNEGANILFDKMDIGVGRFPVYNLEQATAVVDKTIGYLQNEKVGSWKNQALFMADDGDLNQHVRDADSVANLFQQLNPDMLVRKLYLDAFNQEVSAAGERYPEVKTQLQHYIQSGVLMINYMGHGGWNGFANEQILYGEEIDNMYNDYLPLWVTATCDFTSFDDFKDTGGERLFRNAHGGGVALFTTTRTVYANPNFQLNLEFTKYIINDKIPGLPNRLGDMIRFAKNGRSAFGDSNRMSFALIGDPALLLGNPRSHKVVTDSINGKPFSSLTIDTIQALGVVTLSGSVVSQADSQVDESFNGLVNLTVFDKEEIVKTLDNDQPDESLKNPFSYRDRTNAIFKGSAEVIDGRFTITFMLPKDIRYNFGKGRLVYYAVDEAQNYEGNGSTQDIVIGGEDANAVLEQEGPTITAYLNTPHFKSNDKVNSTPYFVAHLYDESGINTIGSGIGHDLLIRLNNDPQQEYVVNSYYESLLGSYREGVVHFQFPELADGKYELEFKAWDLQNNSSRVNFNFKVEHDLPISLSGVYVYPNPTSEHAYLVYQHNRPNTKHTLQATVYDFMGRKVWHSDVTTIVDGSSQTVIDWNLIGDNGEKVNVGLYLVCLEVSADNNIETRKTIKLLINRQ